jgi:hypothetical protein
MDHDWRYITKVPKALERLYKEGTSVWEDMVRLLLLQSQLIVII